MSEEGTIFTAKVMKLGRVTIPEPVRDLLNIDPGDIVEMKVQKKIPARD